jgi:hypothetical protein
MDRGAELTVTREQLWLIHDLIFLDGEAEAVARTFPLSREFAERLLRLLAEAEDGGFSTVNLTLDPEEAFRLALMLKSTHRDGAGQSVRPLILACIRVALGLGDDGPGGDGVWVDDEQLRRWLS